MTIEDIARICHNANATYCIVHGDYSQMDWIVAPAWVRSSAINGVKAHIDSGLTMTPEGSHESWLKQKQAEGWVYGPAKDPKKKEHPCMVPYSDLPEFQKGKDALFTAIVHALAPRLNGKEEREL